MMNPDTPQPINATPTDAPPFPHHAAPAQRPLEAAERQYGEPAIAVPRWQPEDGDFN